MMIRLAPGLTLPAYIVTEKIAITGTSGSGKTFSSSVLVEGLLDNDEQVVIIDPLDVWWGLQSSADGKGPGYPIYVLGGSHGDIPLEHTAGPLLAEVVVETGVSMVLSLRHLSKAKGRQFVAEFLERLYELKGDPKHRTPLHLVIDEADIYAPQAPRFDERGGFGSRALGAVDDIVRRGRSSGFGITLITQRPAVISKDVLSQTQTLIAFQVTHARDRSALEEWIAAHDAEDRKAEFLASLATLDVGEAWVWSPKVLQVFKRVKINRRTTFDSSATPKRGEQPKVPKARAQVDLGALSEQMAATLQQVKDNDPKMLREKVRRLEAEREQFDARLAAATAAAVPSEPVEIEVEVDRPVPYIPDEVLVLLAEFDTATDQLGNVRRKFGNIIDTVGTEKPAQTTPARRKPSTVARPAAAAPPPVRPAPTPGPTAPVGDEPLPKVDKAMRKVLQVLAVHGERTMDQLFFQTGYSGGASTVGNALSKLRKLGHVTPGGQPIEITQSGVDALGPYEPLPTGLALLEFWRHHKLVDKAMRLCLDALLAAYPDPMTREDLCEATDYSPDASTVGNAMSKLRKLELVGQPSRGQWVVSAEFVEATR